MSVMYLRISGWYQIALFIGLSARTDEDARTLCTCSRARCTALVGAKGPYLTEKKFTAFN